MLQFFKYVFATLVGIFLFFVISFFLMIGIASMFSSGSKTTSVDADSVLKINLNQEIVENAPQEDPFSFLSNSGSKVGLVDLKSSLKNAALDPNIKGLYLDLEQPMAGIATLEELRNSLIEFKKSKKFVYTYAETMTEPAVYLASVSDKIFLNEAGGIEFNGLNAQITFMKGLFEKIGVKPVIFRVGQYKSAIEPFTRTDMSPENKEQTSSYVTSIADHIYGQIASSRGISREKINEILNVGAINSPKDALDQKIVTDIGYFDQFEQILKNKLGLKGSAKVKYVELKDYAKAKKYVEEGDRNSRIAVVIGEGNIISGESDESIASDTWIAELHKAVKDSKTKAIVLRINSGGGSAMASDIMWREIELAKKKKPVIASMGDYAASGGYYMAMGCDTIVANPTTVTGSIGIFGMLFNAQELLNNKLGITFDGVESHDHADFPSMVSEMSDAEKMMIQNSVNEGYEKFTSKAAKGRHMDIEQLKALAGGRVWTGTQAKENGLVDILGDLETAIAVAAKRVGLKEGSYRVKYYPTPKSDVEKFMEKLNENTSAKVLERFGLLGSYMEEVNEIMKMEKLQYRLPYQIRFQ